MARFSRSVSKVDTSDDDFPQVVAELLGAMEYIDSRQRWVTRGEALSELMFNWLNIFTSTLRVVSRKSWILVIMGILYVCFYGTGAIPA